MSTKSDHKLVMTHAHFKWPFSKASKNGPAIDNTKFNDQQLRAAYTNETRRLLSEQCQPENNQQRWNNIVNATTTAAKTVFGMKSKQHINPNPEIEVLSRHQKKLKLDRDSNTNVDIREKLRKERNQTLNKIHLMKTIDETAKN